MPNLNSISLMINTNLQTVSFKGMKFQNTSWNGIADPVETTKSEGKKIVQPMIIDNNGEAKSLVFDDVFNMVVFHKIESLDYKVADPDYGSVGTTMEETAMMKMILSADRSKVKIRPEDIISAAAMGFPKEFKPSDISALSLNSCVIEMGNVNKDVYSVWDQEWQGVPMPLAPEDILCSISYKVISTYNKCCFNLC